MQNCFHPRQVETLLAQLDRLNQAVKKDSKFNNALRKEQRHYFAAQVRHSFISRVEAAFCRSRVQFASLQERSQLLLSLHPNLLLLLWPIVS